MFSSSPDVPAAPDAPEPSNVTPTTVTLTWTPPKRDGGSPITGYILEMKDRFATRWTQVNQDSMTEVTCTLKTLKEGTEYQFRVIAVNKAGQSKPSTETIVIAKHPFGKHSATLVYVSNKCTAI